MRTMDEIEVKEGKPITAVLDERYEAHRTQSKVAKSLGISQSTLSIWLVKLGLEQKTILVRKSQDKTSEVNCQSEMTLQQGA